MQRARKLKRKTKRFLFKAAVMVLLVFYGLVILEQQIRPVMMTMAQYECQQLCVNAMNQAVADALTMQPDHLQDLYQVNTDASGKITSVVANPLAINTLKAELTNQVSQRLAALGANAVSIPFGTLLGWQVVAGRGPDLRLRIIQEAYVDSDIHSSLQNSGINQTELLVFITFQVKMGVILSGYTAEVDVQDEICIAQALVVGDVPEFFVQ